MQIEISTQVTSKSLCAVSWQLEVQEKEEESGAGELIKG
jgi:hypothetical protein